MQTQPSRSDTGRKALSPRGGKLRSSAAPSLVLRVYPVRGCEQFEQCDGVRRRGQRKQCDGVRRPQQFEQCHAQRSREQCEQRHDRRLLVRGPQQFEQCHELLCCWPAVPNSAHGQPDVECTVCGQRDPDRVLLLSHNIQVHRHLHHRSPRSEHLRANAGNPTRRRRLATRRGECQLGPRIRAGGAAQRARHPCERGCGGGVHAAKRWFRQLAADGLGPLRQLLFARQASLLPSLFLLRPSFPHGRLACKVLSGIPPPPRIPRTSFEMLPMLIG